MLPDFFSQLDQYIVEGILALIATYGGFLGRWLLRTKESRLALHSALMTGVSLVSGKIYARVFDTPEKVDYADLVDELVDYVELSVPDALKFLRPSRDQLELMAQSYIVPKVVDLRSQMLGSGE
tara:strand:+ start:3873 stop:4244 length:372 start_codon:yes stop_codon:yes gene_type:complete